MCAFDLTSGYITGNELIEAVLKYNKNEAKKDKATQKPIVIVELIDGDVSPLVPLSADQMARAEGFVFVTDKDGAKEAKEDKRFVTMEYDYDGKTFAEVFVLLNGNLTEKQKKEMEELARDKKQELRIFGEDKIKANKSQLEETSEDTPIKVETDNKDEKENKEPKEQLIVKKVPDEQIEEQDKAKEETEKQRQEEEEKAKEEVKRQRKEEEERRRREEEALKRLKEENERNLKGSEFSGEKLQKVREGIKNTKDAILRVVRQAKSEYTVKKYALYLCSVEEIIKAADENKNLMKLTLPWQKCQELYPLEGNLTAALRAIAKTKSEHEWTIVLDGIADAERDWVSRELQESISQAIDRRATRRCCYNPINGTIAVVKKKKFPETWREAMEACFAKDNWVDVYEHDLKVPGFDFVAPAMVAQHYWDLRGYRFKFEATMSTRLRSSLPVTC